MTFNFGQYRGMPLDDKIPTSYLQWCLRECTNLGHYERACIIQELEDRGGKAGQKADEILHRATANKIALLHAIIHERVRDIYRDLARIYHPDLGGSVEAMRALNEFKDRLIKAFPHE
jgi:hypothetical protein